MLTRIGVPSPPPLAGLEAVEGALSLSVRVWPTLPGAGEQVIVCAGGLELFLDGSGAPPARLGDVLVGTGVPLLVRDWYMLELTHASA